MGPILPVRRPPPRPFVGARSPSAASDAGAASPHPPSRGEPDAVASHHRPTRSLIAIVALSFLAGGLVVPQLVSATVSSGEREAFFPLPPTRILDTRFGVGGSTDLGASPGALNGSGTATFQVCNRGAAAFVNANAALDHVLS
jgi:hypothetical protein